MSKLAGKNILVTGASQGLGREMALRFAREGAAGVSLVARHADRLNALRDEIRKIAPKIDIVVIEADVSKPHDIERMVATTLAQFKGHLDVLVNNASTIGPSPMPNLLDYPVEDFREVIDTNLIGPFLLIKKAVVSHDEHNGREAIENRRRPSRDSRPGRHRLSHGPLCFSRLRGEYFVSRIAADKINRARENGGRVIAVGTTVVRALESVADKMGRVKEAHGYTGLRVNNHHRLKVVDALLTGLHEPEASHLDLLSAFLPAEQIRVAYEEAIRHRYLWHEFGDLNLIL